MAVAPCLLATHASALSVGKMVRAVPLQATISTITGTNTNMNTMNQTPDTPDVITSLPQITEPLTPVTQTVPQVTSPNQVSGLTAPSVSTPSASTPTITTPKSSQAASSTPAAAIPSSSNGGTAQPNNDTADQAAATANEQAIANRANAEYTSNKLSPMMVQRMLMAADLIALAGVLLYSFSYSKNPFNIILRRSVTAQ